MADPGFFPGGAPTPKVGVLTYFFGRKLHENERIWTPKGGMYPWRPPLDPPLFRVNLSQMEFVSTRNSTTHKKHDTLKYALNFKLAITTH